MSVCGPGRHPMRPFQMSLARGEAGLLADFDITMTLSGYRSVKDLNASALKWHPTGSASVPSATGPCKL